MTGKCIFSSVTTFEKGDTLRPLHKVRSSLTNNMDADLAGPRGANTDRIESARSNEDYS